MPAKVLEYRGALYVLESTYQSLVAGVKVAGGSGHLPIPRTKEHHQIQVKILQKKLEELELKKQDLALQGKELPIHYQAWIDKLRESIALHQKKMQEAPRLHGGSEQML